jgi:hypothetical protein
MHFVMQLRDLINVRIGNNVKKCFWKVHNDINEYKSSVADQDPKSGAFLAPGSEIRDG